MFSELAGREILTFGETIGIRGQGLISAQNTEDAIRLLGTIAGEGLGLTVTDIDNAGAGFVVDTGAGAVFLDDRIANAAISGVAGSRVSLLDGVILDVPEDLGKRILRNIPDPLLEELQERTGFRVKKVQLDLVGQFKPEPDEN